MSSKAPLELAVPDADAFATGLGRYGATRFSQGTHRWAEESLVEEMPVALNYNDHPHAVMLATPTDLEDFAIGFSITEGIVESGAEISEVDVVPSRHGLAIMIRIPAGRAERLERLRRNLPGAGGCGLCGVENLEAAIRNPRPVARTLSIPAAAISKACDALPALQSLGQRTGASHAAVFVRPDGIPAVLREDAARHNALDKLVGHLSRSGPISSGFVLVTSRASYELVQKAATAGIEMLAAISAPTGLAVRLARASGVTLVGFAREGRLTCYANESRLRG